MFNLPPMPEGSTIVARTGPDRIDLSWSIGNFPWLGKLFIGGFLAFWLMGWAAGEAAVIFQLWNAWKKGGAGFFIAEAFLVFWLIGWTVGGLFAMAILAAILWPARPERLVLTADALRYDPGWGASVSTSSDDEDDDAARTRSARLRRRFARQGSDPAQALRSWKRRTVPKEALTAPRFERLDAGWRLSFDCGTDRIEVGTVLTDAERLWLFDVLEFWRAGRLSPHRPDPADLLAPAEDAEPEDGSAAEPTTDATR